MNDEEFKAEHQANVIAVQVAFDGLSMDELKHIASTACVDAIYAEATNKKTFAMLQDRIARQPFGVPGSSIAFAAGVEFGTTTAIRLTINGMPYLKALARSASAKHAVAMRFADDEKQRVKLLIEAEWKARRAVEAKGRWFSKFAEEMVKKYPEIEEPRTVRKWCTDWEEQQPKK